MAKRKTASARATAAGQRSNQRKKSTKKSSVNRGSAPRKSGRKYKKNFLKQVIARIDFASTLAKLEDGPPKSVLSSLKAEFPVAEQKKQTLQQVVVSNQEVHRGHHEIFQWFYHSKDRGKRVYIGPEAMFVEYSTYNCFEELLSDFTDVSNALFDAFPELQVKRLGLRYIDHIEPKETSRPTEWSKYLHPDLLASFRLADDQGTIARAFNVLEFNYGDMRMRFQFGMPNPDFPAAIKQKLFVLDYDAYCTLLLGRDELSGRLDEYHEKIKRSFEQVITDDLRKLMGVSRGS